MTGMKNTRIQRLTITHKIGYNIPMSISHTTLLLDLLLLMRP